MKVTLVRHTSVDVPKGVCYGWSDVPVAVSFQEEAERTKRLLDGRKFDMAFSSPLSRARVLAEYCGFADCQTDERLKELNMGDWEMKKYDEIEDDNLQKWYDDYMHQPTTNGESFPQLYLRVSSFLDWLKMQAYDNVAIFSHCGVLICAGVYAGLFGEKDCFKHSVGYGEIEEIEI